MSDEHKPHPGFIVCARCGKSKGKHSWKGSRCPTVDGFSDVDRFKPPRNHKELARKLREYYS